MLTRRRFLGATTAGAAACLSSCSSAPAAPPNVLFLIADDLNDYGFYDTLPGVKMPHLDKFKETAVTFTRAYCAAPACVPSRAAVFSGLAPHTTGAYRNGSDPWNKPPFDTAEAMPENFKRSGYTNFGRGKLFHSQPDPARKAAMWDNEHWGGGFGPFPPEEDQVLGKFWGTTAWTGPDSDFPDVKNADAAVEFLAQPQDKPFFLAYGLWRPHTPFTAPKRFFDLYDPADVEIPLPSWQPDDLADVGPLAVKLAEVWGERFDRDDAMWRRFVHAYLACTTFADDSAGRVIEALDQSPYADNTIVVFFSDNGYHCGEKNHWEKTTLWEQASLTPTAIRLPGKLNGGMQCQRTVSTLDLWPTLADLCNLQPAGHELHGNSLRPLLENPDAEWDKPALTTYGEGYGSVRGERYRYIRYPDGAEELYDHEADPHEFNNLAPDPALTDVKSRLGAHMPTSWTESLGGRLARISHHGYR
jgi:arylsulfatase A-like enzyme